MSPRRRSHSDTPGKTRRGRQAAPAPGASARKIPDGESGEQATVDEFAREGMGISSKE